MTSIKAGDLKSLIQARSRCGCVHARCARVAEQASRQGLPELLREVTVLGIYRHPNIVPLLSFSLSRRDDGQQEACLVCLSTSHIRPAQHAHDRCSTSV